MKVYIEAIGNFPLDDWAMCAMQGFKSKGANIVLYEDLEQVPRNRNTLLVATIEDTKKFFEDMEYKVRYDISFPEPLEFNYKLWKRSLVRIGPLQFDNLYKALESINDFRSTFCKPANVKEFTPGIIKTQEDFKKILDLNTEVILSDVVNFVSEYRCFIVDRKIRSCQHYLGDLYKYPDLTIVDLAIELMGDTAPIGYSIDVGVLDTGETALVELNDGWSLGSYGCDPKVYSRLLAERWIEILKQNPII